ncbi:LysE family translocator [Tabrizicola thermarum]|uniref:LysE family translocator n=1 Tax=Tabrizicola thermarum TaxID=2670345 RepID=UPI000FFC40A0|nr:LysE family translocator [Tabrizicola thermarum]
MLPVEPLALLAFIPAGLALNLTPGADMMFCLGQGLKSGRRAAMAANVGIAVGGLVHTTLAALGLGALLAAHPAAFEAIRWLGVGYLLWLAAGALRSSPFAAGSQVAPITTARAFRQGLMVNLMNPKVILFILAFLPQFVNPARPILPQFLTLGLVFCAGGLIVNGAVGLFAGTIGQRIARSAGLAAWLSRISATIFGALALRLALLPRS